MSESEEESLEEESVEEEGHQGDGEEEEGEGHQGDGEEEEGHEAYEEVVGDPPRVWQQGPSTLPRRPAPHRWLVIRPIGEK